MPASASTLPSHAKRDASAATGMRPRVERPRRRRCVAASVPAKPGPSGRAATFSASAVAGSASPNCARSTSRASMSADDEELRRERRERSPSTATAALRNAPSRVDADPFERARHLERRARPPRYVPSPAKASSPASANGATAPSVRVAGQRAVVGDEAQLAHRVPPRAARVAERDAGDGAAAARRRATRARSTPMLRDRRPRAAARGSPARPARACFDDSLKSIARRLAPRPCTMKRRDTRSNGAPRERDVARLDVDVVAAPRDARDAHRRQQRTLGALDRQASFALASTARRSTKSSAACVPSARVARRPARRPARRRASAIARSARRRRRGGGTRRGRRRGGWRARRWLRTRARPRSAGARSATSWPYATSRRNGPIGVRRRAPTP